MLRRVYILIITILLVIAAKVNATNEPDNVLIISGQVINKNDGSSVVNHKVSIMHFKSRTGVTDYFNELYTDEDGFYTDTIVTSWNKGSLLIRTLDDELVVYDTTLTFRFFRSVQQTFLVNFQIDLPIHVNIVSPRFKYAQKQGGNKFYYKFIDLTKSNNIVNRKWSFGDGTFSTLKDPDHTYDLPGLYRVKLTVETVYSGNKMVNSFSKMLLIPYKSYYHIGGQVFTNSFPIDVGKAFLYFKDSADSFIPVDTVVFDTLGYYIFYNIPQGEYIIKAQPCEVSENYGKVFPTYYGNVLIWEKAETCNVNSTCWDYDINLREGAALFTGDGAIKGNIKIVDNGLKHFGVGSAANITIYLFDEIENNMRYLYTDENGIFDFSGLDLGKYKLYPEVTGVITSKIPVEINEDEPEVTNVVIELSLEGATYIILKKDGKPDLIQNIYPNPVTENPVVLMDVRANKPGLFVVTIANMSGKILNSQQILLQSGYNQVMLQTDNLSNGIYVVNIQSVSGKSGSVRMVINR